MNLKTILRALGVKIEDHHIEALENVIRQTPAKANELIHFVGSGMKNFDERLVVLEKQNREILEILNHGRAERDSKYIGGTNDAADTRNGIVS